MALAKNHQMSPERLSSIKTHFLFVWYQPESCRMVGCERNTAREGVEVCEALEAYQKELGRLRRKLEKAGIEV